MTISSDLWASLVAQMVKRLTAMRETWVRSLGREDPLEKEMAIHSSTLAWKIPWMEEPDRLQSVGSQRVGDDWATSLHFINIVNIMIKNIIKLLKLDYTVTIISYLTWMSLCVLDIPLWVSAITNIFSKSIICLLILLKHLSLNILNFVVQTAWGIYFGNFETLFKKTSPSAVSQNHSIVSSYI